jgi:crotonobetainyl-CoA:carnitine CoA-transferase CaiB-like acyl-CoA transferase
MSSPTKFWEGLADAVDRPEMLAEPQFADRSARITNYGAVVDYLAPLFAARSRPEWCARLQQREVPHSPVYSSGEVLQSEQARHLQIEVEAEHPTMGMFRTIRSPVSFDGVRALDIVPPPTLGEHNAEILRQADKALLPD